jgi:hypothetical protein
MEVRGQAAPGAAGPRAGFAVALDARLAPRAATPGLATARTSPGAPLATALGTVERAQTRLDAVLAQARAGRTFTSAELLALQAEAYRCAQVVDLGAKLAEQGAQAVRQALNTQL